MNDAEAIPWEPILACCASGLDHCSAGATQIRSELRTGASRLVFFEAGLPDQVEAFVVKLPRTNVQAVGWDATREYAALQSMQHLAQSGTWTVPAPIGVSTDPPFMITRHVVGSSLRPLAERGMRRWSGSAALQDSLAWCERLGTCRRDLRTGASDAAPDQRLSADDLIAFCHARLEELASHRGGSEVEKLRTELGQWIEQSVPRVWSDAGHLFTRAYPCHGDFSFQNILVSDGQPMCLVDLEGFKTVPVDIDYAKFRFRFEQQRLHPAYSTARLTRCWERFHRTVCVDPGAPGYFLLSYLHTLLALLAWAARFAGDTTRGNWRIRLRSRLWVRQRLSWLKQIDRRVSVEHMVQRLVLDL